jgi:hypothetical protein
MPERVRIPLLKASRLVESMLARSQLGRSRSEFTDQVIADLRSEGVHMTTVERLLGADAPAYREAMARAAQLLKASDGHDPAHWSARGASTDLLAPDLLKRLPEFFLAGLNARFLALAEQYLRVPAAYHGAVFRHSFPDGHQVGPRRWHRDAEDFHVLRTVVYLNDVTEDGGPFEYIPRHIEVPDPDKRSGTPMRSDEEMAAVVPMSQWKRCVGPAGTVIIADSARVFHHESLQRRSDRSVIMMGHSSRRPNGRPLAMAHFPVDQNIAALTRLVAPEHHAAVFGWRGLDVTAATAKPAMLIAGAPEIV